MAPKRISKKKKAEVKPEIDRTKLREEEKPQRRFLALLTLAFTVVFTIITVGMTYVISKEHGGLSMPIGFVIFNLILVAVCGITVFDWLRK